jgi:transposase
VIRPNQLLVLALVEQLRVTLRAIDSFDAEIATVSQTLPDYALFRVLPGAGATLAPRLLVAFGEQRERYGSAAEVQRYAGIAPVTESSGKKHWVHWRRQCPTFVRQTFVEWAGATISAVLLGRCLLSTAARQRMLASSSGARLGLQMDSHSLSLLANPNPLR